MNSREFLQRIANFNGTHEEFNELYHGYVYSEDAPVAEKVIVLREADSVIKALKFMVIDDRNKNLSFSYEHLYVFQQVFLPQFYWGMPGIFDLMTQRQDGAWALYKLFCSSNNTPCEFTENDFEVIRKQSGIYDYIVIVFKNTDTHIDYLAREMYFPLIPRENENTDPQTLAILDTEINHDKVLLHYTLNMLGTGVEGYLHSDHKNLDYNQILKEIDDMLDFTPTQGIA